MLHAQNGVNGGEGLMLLHPSTDHVYSFHTSVFVSRAELWHVSLKNDVKVPLNATWLFSPPLYSRKSDTYRIQCHQINLIHFWLQSKCSHGGFPLQHMSCDHFICAHCLWQMLSSVHKPLAISFHTSLPICVTCLTQCSAQICGFSYRLWLLFLKTIVSTAML